MKDMHTEGLKTHLSNGQQHLEQGQKVCARGGIRTHEDKSRQNPVGSSEENLSVARLTTSVPLLRETGVALLIFT